MKTGSGQAELETISDRRRRVAERTLSLDDVRREVSASLEANKGLNAFISVMIEDASNGDPERPLAGVPIGIKDFFDTAGVRTTAGAKQYADRVPTQDADIVARLKTLGPMIVGKTNMHTLGMGTTTLESHFGPVHNPSLPDRVAGGSSGGSAAAVASGICFATIDTDAVGSARLPAACCAVTAFKPSYGRLPTEGILRGEPVDEAILALNHTSITARSAADAAFLFALLAGTSVARGTSQPRLGVVKNYSAPNAMRRAFEALVRPIAGMGASSTKVTVPFSEARFDPAGIEDGRAHINERLFADVDLIVLPTLVDPVPTIEAARSAGAQAVSPANTFFANYFGLPAISVPMQIDEALGPIAVQIVGPVGADDQVLDFGQKVQKLYPPMLARG